MATYSQRIVFFTIRIFHCPSYGIHFFYGFRAMLYNCFNYLIFCDFATITSIRQFHFNGEPTTYMAKEFLFLAGLIPFVVYKLRQTKKR